MFSGHGLEVGLDGISPGQKLIQAALGMAVDDADDDVGQVAGGIDAVEFAGLDQGSDDGSVLGAAVGAGEECIFPMRVSGRMPRSTVLESISMRPSSRKRQRPPTAREHSGLPQRAWFSG